MTVLPWLDERPLLVAIAGPDGAGKTTFYHAHVAPAGLPLVDADRLALELSLDAYQAAEAAAEIRRQLVGANESCAFETVFSDPVAAEVRFWEEASAGGYTVALLFVGLASAKQSIERVAMRVTQGGHDVPDDKLIARYPRTLANLHAAMESVQHVLIYDNSDLADPYRFVAQYELGRRVRAAEPLPRWLPVRG
ncbi:Zeta toxin [Pirellulimonas nuda]|uniref:Zeta toxin n=1 Tax=Pirellulimonas nuda TaxID=2528009 RepID=A0A518DCX9_9BACT|nr:hypothetical protein [Pirellulimonas nuda]QDU89319.1 Zeta toxin [Pirellulimonas nuda]